MATVGILFGGTPLLADATNHPNNTPGVPLIKDSEEVLDPTCCCVASDCVCIPQLAALGYPDLSITISRDPGTTCAGSDCFDPDVTCTLSWNGTEYAVDECTFDCSEQEFLAIRLACSAVTDVEATCEEPACTAEEWQIQFVCGTDCFEGCFTPASCSPLEISGTVCKSTDCCRDGFGSPVADACLNFDVILAP
jgi:hypothetical protein